MLSALRQAVFELGLPFWAFLCAALWVSWCDRRGARGPALRRHVNVLLAISLLASFGVACVGRNAWPFSKWPLVAGHVPQIVDHPRFLALDAAGVEHELDWRAWQPIPVDELTSWASTRLPALDDAQRAEALGHLLVRLEQARRAARGGIEPGTFSRHLGPLHAPMFLLHPERWTSPESTPAQPFVELRLYRERWNVEERARDGALAVTRELVASHRRP